MLTIQLAFIRSLQVALHGVQILCSLPGDPITDLMEDMAAEQKARTTYDNILRLVKDDPDVYAAIKFLREREIVHFQRFGESLRIVQDHLDSRNFYAFNPAFDTKKF